MGLTTSLNIGRSALTSSQVALQITGNNFANASTVGYSRQVVSFVPSADQRWGSQFVGRGVQLGGITRQVDNALQARMWGGLSQESAALVGQQFLSNVESIVNQLGDNSLSSEFDRFFSAWSELANSPNRDGARSLVVQQGRTLGSAIRATRSDLLQARDQLDGQLGSSVSEANNLLSQIATINQQIVSAEAGTPGANSLRDQRDQLVGNLARLMDISVVEQPSGAMDVLVGSTPVVLGGLSRGVELQRRAVGSDTEVSVNVRADGTQLSVNGGSVGGLLAQRSGVLDQTLDKLDTITSQLIFQLNRIHSTGYGATPISSVTSTRTVPASDVSRSLNDPANQTFASLPFQASNGGFLVTVRNEQTGASQTVRVNVDLDGIQNNASPGYADDTSIASLAADIGSIPNVSATVNPDGTLKIAAATGYSVAFSEDTSGVLAVIGVNTYFTGKDATDIDVRAELTSTPGLLATGRVVNGEPTDNSAALLIAGLKDKSNSALNDSSISGAWRDAGQVIGAASAAATSRADSASLVRSNLEAQRSAISGVSMDEESINLINFQRQYQGAARFISAIDELTQTLLNIV